MESSSSSSDSEEDLSDQYDDDEVVVKHETHDQLALVAQPGQQAALVKNNNSDLSASNAVNALIQSTSQATPSSVSVEEGNVETLITGPVFNINGGSGNDGINIILPPRDHIKEEELKQQREEEQRLATLEEVTSKIRFYYEIRLLVPFPLPWIQDRAASGENFRVELIITNVEGSRDIRLVV